MYLVEEEDPLDDDQNPAKTGEPATDSPDAPPEISFHTLTGDEVPQLMHVEGKLHGRKVSVLIDIGSTQLHLREDSSGIGVQCGDATSIQHGPRGWQHPQV